MSALDIAEDPLDAPHVRDLPFHVDPPSAARSAESEHAIQCAFRNMAARRFPGVRVIAVPNGAKRSISGGKRMQREGLTAGVPDVICVWSGGQVAWIEFKSRDGSLSPTQKSVLLSLHNRGHRVAVCRSPETALALLERWGAG